MNFESLRRGSAAFASGLAAALLMASSQALAGDAPKSHNTKTVFIILMENHNWTGDGATSIKGNPNAPYINNTLLPMASHTERYFNPPNIHPSLPNYLWLEAGTNFDVSGTGRRRETTRAPRTTW
jgi:hypothetical protein